MQHFSPHVWDYSVQNVLLMRSRNVSAHHVPIGFSAALHSHRSSLQEAHPQTAIDVLFYGRLNAYRESALGRLREAGIRVMHANAFGPVFGSQLHDLIHRAKIVLNLRYFAGLWVCACC